MNPTPPDHTSGRLTVARLIPAAIGLALLVVLVAGLVAAVVGIRNSTLTQTAVLPGGERFRLLSVTYGEKGEFTTTNALVNLLRRILPARYQNVFPPPLTVPGGWVGNSGPTGLRMLILDTPPPSNSWQDLNIETEDEAGFRYTTTESTSRMLLGFPPTNNQQVYQVEPTMYPRRQQEFLLRISTFSGSNLATFKIHNPATGPFPEWQPSAMPGSLTNGPVKLTLQGLDVATTGWRRMVTGRWKIESGDPAWSNARIRSVTLLDSSGNHSDYRADYIPNPTNAFAKDWWATNWGNSPLSPRETAWKVRALVERPNRQDFAASEIVSLTNVPVPRLTTPDSPAEHASDAGSNLTIQVVHLGSGYPSNANFYLTSFYVDVKARQFGPDDELHFIIRDDQGRPLPNSFGQLNRSDFSGNGTFNLQMSGHARLDFSAAPDARYINIECYISHALRFEFLVDPRDVRPASSPARQ